MQPDIRLLQAVESVYNWLDTENRQRAEVCKACGKCCDFTQFDHHLFVTTPEIIYLAAKLGPGDIRQMHNNICPYNENGQCTIREYRFAGCRVFFCGGEPDFQARLSEKVIKKFSSLCDKFQLSYRYMPIKDALSKIGGSLQQ